MEHGKAAAELRAGLEGVIVAETHLSHVDGERGELVIRGRAVQELAASCGFEAADLLLRTGRIPDSEGLARHRADLGNARCEAFSRILRLGEALKAVDGMEALRGAIAQLPETSSASAIVGAVATFAAAWWRVRAGLAPVAPSPDLSHASDYLRMVRGEPPAPEQVRGLDAYLVTVIDHGMNASTFTTRVVASTGSDRVSAIVGGIGALKGPLHGGAPGPVLDMLDAIGEAENAERWLLTELGAGRRIMGMGHRIYRVRDPRAEVLEAAVERLGQTQGGRRLRLARAVESTAQRILRDRHPGRPLLANVEFYTAVLLEAVGLPRELFAPTFAVSRVAGWSAHFDEQRAAGRLIRPNSRYIGPMPAVEGTRPANLETR